MSENVEHLKRTIFIGLGGTGKRALLFAKRQFIETFGEVPPLAKFLLIDTTNANGDSLTAIDPDGKKQTVRLNPRELLFIEARGASLLPKVNDEVRDWFPPRAELKANILSGAGQVRALGRLALFANARNVYESLRNLLVEARDYSNERPSTGQKRIYLPYNQHLSVCVAGSLAGGTGSGTFLDIALILRDLMRDEDQLFGYLLLPDVYVNRPGTQNVEANAYAALQELDYCMNLKETWAYPFGGREISVTKKPFDMVFLVNQVNRAGKSFAEVDDLAELMGAGLFLSSGPLGKQQADIFDNIVVQLAGQQAPFYGKTAHYASFGASQLRFKPFRLDREGRLKTAQEAVRLLTTKTASEVDVSELRQFYTTLKSLPSELEPLAPSPAATTPDEDKARINGAKQELMAQINAWSGEDAEAAHKQRPSPVASFLAARFGTHSIEDLIIAMQLVDRENQVVLELLRKRAKESLDGFTGQIEKLELAASKNRGIPSGLLRRAKPSTEPMFDKRAAENLAKAALGSKRERAILLVFEADAAALKTEIGRLKELREALEQWLTHFEQKEQPTEAEDDRPRPFQLELPTRDFPSVFSEAPTSALALDFIRDRGLAALQANPTAILDSAFNHGLSNKLAGWLHEILRERDRDLTPAEIEAQATVSRVFRELSDLAEPAFQYQDAWVSNPKTRIERVNIVGLPGNDSNDTLRTGIIDDLFAGNLNTVQRADTNHEDRVYFYKIEASIPAYALQGLELYREKYFAMTESRSFHLMEKWEQIEDLMPLPGVDEAAKVWTKARALGVISDDYSYRTDRGGVGRLCKLGASIADAMKSFSQDFFAFKEVEQIVGKKYQEATSSRLEDLKGVVNVAIVSRCDLKANTDFSVSDRMAFAIELGCLENLRDELEIWESHDFKDMFLPLIGL